ncbi:tigger transposable element-derived protein 6-like [Hetaerina americana]|uniref:tigger transposable element-derived protein 6-like n=1 Tax=Hetaerina americana TaxID=62018 RepID=UPI003A7F135B
MSCKTYRGSLSLEMRVRVIKESEKGISHRNLASKFGCGKTQIASILQHKDELLREWEAAGKRDCFIRKPPSQIKRMITKLLRAPPPVIRKKQEREKRAKIDNLVWAWLRDANTRCIPISGNIIKEKAVECAKGLFFPSFTPDDEWLDYFRKRHNIMSLTAYDGSNNLDANSFVEWNIEALPTVENYDPKNIYNVDEIGLFFREIPGKTLLEKINMCVGGKLAKERFTVSLCCNALGDKEPLIVVSNHFQPKHFNNIGKKWGVDWRVNGNSWMSSTIFTEWLQSFNEKMKLQGRKILLFMDTAPCHPNKSLSNIELQFIGPKRPIFLQPIGEGIAQSFKFLYRKKLMRHVLARMVAEERAPSKNIDLTSVIWWMSTAWKEVKPETISKCFMMCGIAGKMSHVKIVWETNEYAELDELCKAANIDETVAYENIQCHNERGQEWDEDTGENVFCDPPNLLSSKVDEDEDNAPTPPYSIGESLAAIDRLRVTFSDMNSEGAFSHVFDNLVTIEESLEDVLIKGKIKSY